MLFTQTSRQFELLNYSEHGTTVDNVLYSCDFSEKATPAPKVSPVVANVRKVIAKAKAKQDAEKEAEKARMNSHAARVGGHCDKIKYIVLFIYYVGLMLADIADSRLNI